MNAPAAPPGLTGQSMVAPLTAVLVKRPGRAGASDWAEAGWHDRPVPDRAEAEHAAFRQVLLEAGAAIVELPTDARTGADSIYCHDPCLATDDGLLLLPMGKASRRSESVALADAAEALGIPIAGWLPGSGTAEGGDLVWLDRSTLLAGRGLRTDAAGIAALRGWFEPRGVEVVEVPLPWGEGPSACLHLMSLLSMLDDDLAVVHLPLLPVPLVELLEARSVRLVPIPVEEYPTQGCNVLAVGPRNVVLLDANPRTADRLAAAGCRVHTIAGAEMAMKGDGGPTCLTRPVWRSVSPPA